MSRRPFDASFSRRPGQGSGPGGGLAPSAGSAPPVTSLMGDYHRGGGGGYRGEDEQVYSSGGSRALQSRSRPSVPYDDEDEFDGFISVDHIPREVGVRGQIQSDYNNYNKGQGSLHHHDGGGGNNGCSPSSGWRQRSPSPISNRFGREDRDRERGGGGREDHRRVGGGGGGGISSWTTRSNNDYLDDYGGGGRHRGGGGGSVFDNTTTFQQQQQQQIMQQQMFQPRSILRNSVDPVMNVLLQPGSLMGSIGLNANPFGVLGASPMVVGSLPTFASASPFGQQQLIQQQASNPFGSGIGVGGGGSSIYGSQTQQALDHSRNLITASNDGRRRDFNRGGGGGRRSEPERNRSNSDARNDSPRKRNLDLVLRDPHPDEGIKRPRISAGGGNKKTTQVKRVDILGDGKKSGNSHRPVSSGKKEDKEKDKESGDVKSSEEKKKDKEADKDRKTEYDDVPGCFLVCKVCQKVMNDGQSFESHLSGRAHQSLMKILEERFSKRVELLMNESKCYEDEIGIEMDRQRRAGSGKGGRADKNPSNYCKMCDCHYSVNWGAHKVSMGHRILKEFLHPTCQFCNAHFMHRKDWVIHLLSPGHMKRLQELKEELGTNPVLEEQESPHQDELFTLYVDLNRDERTTNAITIKSKDGREPLTEEMKDILKNDRGEIVLPDGEIPLPKEYNQELMVGADAVVAVSGSRCRVCRAYIAEDKSVDTHCSSREHFNQYVSFLRRVNRHREHKERERKEAEEKVRREEERAKRRAEEKAKADATKKDKKAESLNGETSTGNEEKQPSADGDVDNSEMNMEVDTVDKEKNESVENDSAIGETNEVFDVEEDAEDQEEEEDEEEEHDEDNNLEDDDDEEEVEGEEAFIPISQDEKQEEDVQIVDGAQKDEIMEEDFNSVEISGSDEIQAHKEEETLPEVVSEGNPEAADEDCIKIVGVSGGYTIDFVKIEEQKTENGGEEESNDFVEQIEPSVTKTAGTARARGNRGAATPGGRGRGASTPALKNVMPKVDTNIRGRGSRGGPRSRSPRARGGRGSR